MISCLAIAAVACFNNWILAFVFNRSLIAKGADISDLSALTQPHHNLFRTLDIAAGLLLALLGIILLRWPQKTLGILLAVLGLANVLDAVTALRCTALADRGCSIPTRLNWHHPILPSHIFSSTIIVGTMVVLYMITLKSKRLRPASWTGLVTTVIFLIFLFLAATITWKPLVYVSAITQIIQMFGFSAWLIFLVGFGRQKFNK